MAASVEFQGVQTITPMTDHGGHEGYVRLTNSGAPKVESTIQMFTPQQYCLRWNNHRTNLLTVFDQLLQNEAFTDVTLACEGGTSVKCHKMVLAACSSYFQVLFTDLPCRHPVVILKDVKYTEIKAILEYMYRGEVNVAQDQLAALLKVAEALKVKGLVEENGAGPKPREEEPNMITTSTAAAPPPVPHSSNDSSPPHSTGIHPQGYPKAPYLFTKSSSDRGNGGGGGRLSMPMWGVPGLPHPTPPPASPHTAAVLNSCYEAAMNYRDMPPLRRKKLSSLLMSRGDTPILRTVLGQGQGLAQGQADSSQPMPLICHPDSQDGHGSPRDGDKSMKTDLSEDAPSPYTDVSFKDEDISDQANRMMMVPYSSPQSGNGDSKVSSGLAVYVPPQKPEWKRYKQYTRNDIMSAIDAVRGGMSALQAARKYGVPSRTLYDKVKKLGITTGRPFRRSSIGNGGPGFPYNFGNANSSGGGGMMLMGPDEQVNFVKDEGGSGLPPYADHPFLHHALEYRNDTSEATATQQSNHSNHSSSPNGRSPSPTLIRYAHPRSVTPSPPPPDEDRVEDLSMKPEPPSRVIMPPMSQALTAGDNDTRD